MYENLCNYYYIYLFYIEKRKKKEKEKWFQIVTSMNFAFYGNKILFIYLFLYFHWAIKI